MGRACEARCRNIERGHVRRTNVTHTSCHLQPLLCGIKSKSIRTTDIIRFWLDRIYLCPPPLTEKLSQNSTALLYFWVRRSAHRSSRPATPTRRYTTFDTTAPRRLTHGDTSRLEQSIINTLNPFIFAFVFLLLLGSVLSHSISDLPACQTSIQQEGSKKQNRTRS